CNLKKNKPNYYTDTMSFSYTDTMSFSEDLNVSDEEFNPSDIETTKIAYNYLAIQGTSVPCKEMFSIAAKTITKIRNRLFPETA
ncbi:28212_t:CDS:2, partial [Racocetra persica]